MSLQFTILSMDGGGNPRTSDRKLIRSHCMKGKNVRADSRRSKRRARQQISQKTDLINADPYPRGDSPTAVISGDTRTTDVSNQPCREPYMPPPRPSPMDITLLGLPSYADGSCGELLFKYFTYETIKNAFHPMSHCIEFNHKSQLSLQWLIADTAFFHSVLLATAAVDDFINRRIPTQSTRFHLQRTLSLLGDRLSGGGAHTIDSTFFVVLNLAFVAGIIGDHAAATTHMSGLWRIVSLRKSLHPKNHVKVLNLNLWCSLMTGDKPDVASRSVDWEPLYKVTPRPNSTAVNAIIDTIGVPRLTDAYHDLQTFTQRINLASTTGPYLHGTEFDFSIGSLHHRLLGLDYDLDDPLANALHLGMLAFMSTMSRVSAERIPLPYFHERLKSACLTLEAPTADLRHIAFWLLMVGRMSVFEADEQWFRQRWEVVVERGLAWEEARCRLHEIMWISCIHDDIGKKTFTLLNRGRRCV